MELGTGPCLTVLTSVPYLLAQHLIFAHYMPDNASPNSFVSLLSDGGVPIEQIARLVGRSSTSTTERVYHHQIRPVVQGGAEVMDRLFIDLPRGASDEVSEDA